MLGSWKAAVYLERRDAVCVGVGAPLKRKEARPVVKAACWIERKAERSDSVIGRMSKAIVGLTVMLKCLVLGWRRWMLVWRNDICRGEVAESFWRGFRVRGLPRWASDRDDCR